MKPLEQGKEYMNLLADLDLKLSKFNDETIWTVLNLDVIWLRSHQILRAGKIYPPQHLVGAPVKTGRE